MQTLNNTKLDTKNIQTTLNSWTRRPSSTSSPLRVTTNRCSSRPARSSAPREKASCAPPSPPWTSPTTRSFPPFRRRPAAGGGARCRRPTRCSAPSRGPARSGRSRTRRSLSFDLREGFSRFQFSRCFWRVSCERVQRLVRGKFFGFRKIFSVFIYIEVLLKCLSRVIFWSTFSVLFFLTILCKIYRLSLFQTSEHEILI